MRYSIGYAKGDSVRWTLTDGSSAPEALRAASRGNHGRYLDAVPVLREDADPVLMLLVDGTPAVTDAPGELPDLPGHSGEAARWRHVARNASRRKMPTFALLQSTRGGRLRRWRRFKAPDAAVSVQALGSQTATDAAVRLAVASPTSQADFALATRFRPILLFDRAEPVPRPLSVAALFDEGRVQLCRDQGVQPDCNPIRDARELENGRTHLKLLLPSSRNLKKLARRELAINDNQSSPTTAKAIAASVPEGSPPPGSTLPDPSAPTVGAGSAIYVHPVSVERDGRLLLYIDYWWYLPGNRARVGGGAFCGAGLVIPGLTCHDHESDWEGMTVIVDRTAAAPRVTAVQYAQHSSVVRYRWRDLRERWDTDPRLAPFLKTVADASARPLAFIASGTHATYPTPCVRGCRQVVERRVGESPHRGDLPWSGNDTNACGQSSCLQMLPTREGGRHPALWNAFAGLWGERHCVLTYYCDSGSPPTAPGRQRRYLYPTRYTGVVDEQGRFRRQPFDL